MPSLFFQVANLEPRAATFLSFAPEPSRGCFDEPSCAPLPLLPGDQIAIFAHTVDNPVRPATDALELQPLGGGPNLPFGTLHERGPITNLGFVTGAVPTSAPPGLYRLYGARAGFSQTVQVVCNDCHTLYCAFEACGDQMGYPYSDYLSVNPNRQQQLRLPLTVAAIRFETNEKVDVRSDGRIRRRYARVYKVVDIASDALSRERAEALQMALAHSFFGFIAPLATSVAMPGHVFPGAAAVGFVSDGPVSVEEQDVPPFKLSVKVKVSGKIMAYDRASAFCNPCLN